MEVMNVVVLMCAVLAALAFGVLLGYACCQVLFSTLKMHASSLAAASSRASAPEASVPQASVAQVQTAS
jgi:hypothetical protein